MKARPVSNMYTSPQITGGLIQELLRDWRARAALDADGAQLEAVASQYKFAVGPPARLPLFVLAVTVFGILGIGQLIAWGGVFVLSGSTGSSMRPSTWVLVISCVSAFVTMIVLVLHESQRRIQRHRGPVLVIEGDLVHLPRQAVSLSTSSIVKVVVHSGWSTFGMQKQYVSVVSLQICDGVATSFLIVFLNRTVGRSVASLASQSAARLGVPTEQVGF